MRYLQTREMTPRGEVMTLVGMGRLLLEGSEVNRLDLQNDYKVPYLTKNIPLSKNMLYIFVHPATTLSLSTFFPHLKKSSPNCAISFIIYKIFHLNIQLTATIECKPQSNMQQHHYLQFCIFKLKGLFLDPHQTVFNLKTSS